MLFDHRSEGLWYHIRFEAYVQSEPCCPFRDKGELQLLRHPAPSAICATQVLRSHPEGRARHEVLKFGFYSILMLLEMLELGGESYVPAALRGVTHKNGLHLALRQVPVLARAIVEVFALHQSVKFLVTVKSVPWLTIMCGSDPNEKDRWNSSPAKLALPIWNGMTSLVEVVRRRHSSSSPIARRHSVALMCQATATTRWDSSRTPRRCVGEMRSWRDRR